MLFLAIAYRHISKRQDFDKDLKGILALKKRKEMPRAFASCELRFNNSFAFLI